MLMFLLSPLGTQALGHSADILASVTLDPVPQAGWRVVRVELRDFYGTAISRAGLNIAVGEYEHELARRADLVEEAPGTYRGLLESSHSGRTLFRVEATLPDGPWLGETSVKVGPAARQVRNLGIALRHRDAPAITPLGWVLIAAFVGAMMLTAVMGGGLLLDRVRSRGRTALNV